jgi:hypothetical protein
MIVSKPIAPASAANIAIAAIAITVPSTAEPFLPDAVLQLSRDVRRSRKR